MPEKLTPEQVRMVNIIKKYKKYVTSYDEGLSQKNNSDKTFLLDMLYRIGIALDPGQFSFSLGFDKFKKYIIENIENKSSGIFKEHMSLIEDVNPHG